MESQSIGSGDETNLVVRDGQTQPKGHSYQSHGEVGFQTGRSKTGAVVSDPRALTENDTLMLMENGQPMRDTVRSFLATGALYRDASGSLVIRGQEGPQQQQPQNEEQPPQSNEPGSTPVRMADSAEAIFSEVVRTTSPEFTTALVTAMAEGGDASQKMIADMAAARGIDPKLAHAQAKHVYDEMYAIGARAVQEAGVDPSEMGPWAWKQREAAMREAVQEVMEYGSTRKIRALAKEFAAGRAGAKLIARPSPSQQQAKPSASWTNEELLAACENSGIRAFIRGGKVMAFEASGGQITRTYDVRSGIDAGEWAVRNDG